MRWIFILMILVSCGKRSKLHFFAPELTQEEAVTFRNLRTDIFESKCISCHKGFQSEEELLRYIDGNDPDKSPLFQVVKNGSMPPQGPPLTTLELEMIRSYISSLPSKEPVTFDRIKKEILNNKCLSCHRKMDNEENLMKWINPTDPADSKFLLRTKDGTMPKNAPPLNNQEIKLIEDYTRGLNSKENESGQ